MIDLSSFKDQYYWIDLSWQLTPSIPHFSGFNAMEMTKQYDVDQDGFEVYTYNIVGQYGTHIDAPSHFIKGNKNLEDFVIDDMVMPLCVINKTPEVEINPDFTLTKADILEWEKNYGTIPEGSFVAFCSGWSKRKTMDDMNNCDTNGNPHYPGWSVEAIKFLIEERHINAIGHETCDTDPASIGETQGYPGETYILSTNHYQIEMLSNLDKCPATGAIIFCTFPNIKNATGFTARCFALCPKEK